MADTPDKLEAVARAIRASALTWLSRRYDVMTLARISRHKNLAVLLQSYYRETPEQIANRLK